VIAQIDRALLDAAAAWRGSLIDGFFLAVTWLGSLWLLVPAGLALAIARWPSPRNFLLLPAALLAASAASHALKALTDRARPALHESLVALPGDPSFPSSHSAQGAAFAVMLGFLLPAEMRIRALPLLGLFILLVGWSRLHLQVHWPSDVITGWLLGACVATLIWFSFGSEAAR
jgi:membrane-associated phospholipid phosphatase